MFKELPGECNNFEKFTRDYGSQSEIAILYFTANWCQPCKAMLPLLEKIVENRDDITVYVADIDACESLAYDTNIMKVPTMLFFRNGKYLTYEAGGKTRKELTKIIGMIDNGAFG